MTANEILDVLAENEIETEVWTEPGKFGHKGFFGVAMRCTNCGFIVCGMVEFLRLNNLLIVDECNKYAEQNKDILNNGG